jgi:uncharacterized membrane protein YkoI
MRHTISSSDRTDRSGTGPSRALPALGVVVAAAMLAFGGAADAARAGSMPPGTSPSGPCPAPPASSVPAQAGSAPATAADGSVVSSRDLGAAQAADRALEIAGGAVMDIDRGTERGQAVWEVVVRQDDGSAVELYIAQATGELVAQHPARSDADVTTPPPLSVQQAVAIAEQAVPGSAVVEADLGSDRGRIVWEVLVRASSQDVELYIDAATCEIVKQEMAD